MAASEQRAPRLRRRPPRRLQGAAQGRDPRRDPEGRDRQAAAHRARRRSWAWRDEDLHLRRRRHRRAARRAARRGRRPRSSLIARGPHLAAMRDERPDPAQSAERDVHASGRGDRRPAELGPQDYVVVTLKAHQVPGVVAADAAAARPGDRRGDGASTACPGGTSTASAGRYEGRRLPSVDPGGVQWDGIGPERVIGCVVYPAAEVVEPGVIEHRRGRPLHARRARRARRRERVERLSQALIAAGLKAPVRAEIRDEIWVKLWGNLSFNPISALTRATLDVICRRSRHARRRPRDDGRGAGDRREARRALPDRRRQAHRRRAAVGAHKTSMLQDLERGRPMEIDALVTAVQEHGPAGRGADAGDRRRAGAGAAAGAGGGLLRLRPHPTWRLPRRGAAQPLMLHPPGTPAPAPHFPATAGFWCR